MAKRSGKPRDVNAMAAAIVAEATGGGPPPDTPDKNPAAVALGRLGGLKGGPARMRGLTKRQRSEMGRKAALARWGKTRSTRTK